MKTRSKLFYSIVFLALVYASVNLIAAPPRTTLQRYHISSSSLRLLDSTVIFPVIIVWFIGLYGFQKLHTYSGYIGTKADGQHVRELTRGLRFLALWLPINSTLSVVLNLTAQHHHGFAATSTIITSYTGLLFPLLAFLYISRGARGLSELVNQRPSNYAINVIAGLLIVVGVFYSYIAEKDHASLQTIYHMPIALILFTIVAPYIFTWFVGLLAAYQLHLYTYKVQGIIYRQSWNYLSFGLIWILILSIVLQYIMVVSAKINMLPLGELLGLLYGVLAILAIGYVFVALGAKKLTRIEEA